MTAASALVTCYTSVMLHHVTHILYRSYTQHTKSPVLLHTDCPSCAAGQCGMCDHNHHHMHHRSTSRARGVRLADAPSPRLQCCLLRCPPDAACQPHALAAVYYAVLFEVSPGASQV